ncbi:hypothetical protein ACFYOT_40475 [Saccharothrix saharensis]|uniref:hypothetical protein n=1 Tax=Saccharothrix saharensis TaxID=571190 RepID=UPI0036B9226A
MGRRRNRGNRARALVVEQEKTQRKGRRVAMYAVVAPLVLTAVMATVFFQEAVDVVVGSTGVDPTSMETRWPLRFGCDLAGVVAMPRGGRKLDELGISFTEDPRQTAVNAGAAAWGQGTLYVSLRTSKDNEVVVNSVQPRHVTRTDEVAVDWLLSQPTTCGGDPSSWPRAPYRLDLETGAFAKVDDEGKVQPLDFVDRVVKVDDPFTFSVDVTGCSGTYRWLLEVKYSYRGHEYTRTVGSVEQPLLSMGGRTDAPVHESNPGTTAPGRWHKTVPSLEKPPCE